MTRFERRLLWDTGLLGTAITLLVVLLDRVGGLRTLELYLDDYRAAHFQYYKKPPTDKLVHLDIDDATLEAVGTFPWSRDKWAKIMTELDRAGAKVVDLDVIFPQVSEQVILPNGEKQDPDNEFAKSLIKFRKEPGRGVLVPLSVNVNSTNERKPELAAVFNAMLVEFSSDLEIESDVMVKRLMAKNIGYDGLSDDVAKMIEVARRQAMFLQVRHELESGRPSDMESLRARLLPKSATSGVRNEAWRALLATLPDVVAYESLLRFTRECPPGLPPLLSADIDSPPIPALAAAAAFTGFVDMWDVDDGKVRSIPLWTMDRGRLMPQMGLALACAELGVSTNTLKLEPNSVTIPLPDGKQIVIPVYTRSTADHGEVGMLMDIPWFGNTEDDGWETMYDWPDHKVLTQHVALAKVWDICQVDPDIQANNIAALEDVAYAVGFFSSNKTVDMAQVRKQAPAFNDAVAWNQLMSDTLDNLPPGTQDAYEPYLSGKANPDSIKDPAERDLVYAIRNLQPTYRRRTNTNLATELSGLRDDLRRQLSGKAVLICEVATAATDFKPTPLYTRTPGVVVHGAIFNAIVTGDFKRHLPDWVSTILTFVVGILVTVSTALFPPLRALISAVLIAFIFLWVDFLVCYDMKGVEINAAGPFGAAALIWGGCTLTRFIRERTEKNRITSRFRSYVDPTLVNYVLEHPEQAGFKGEERELTVCFTDLQGFTTISEILKRETVPLLNEYLGRMEPVIRRNHGYLNKFIGDGIMFFFGAPEPYPGDPDLHAWAAVQTVVQMQRVMISFNEELLKRNLPQLKLRAGVSSGEMVVGDAGSPERSDYTVLGDRVNFAARLESANKYTGTPIMVGDRTVELLKNKYLVRPIGKLLVVGKDEPVMTYEPLAPIEEATSEMRKLAELTTAMTEAYMAGKFDECIAASHALLAAFGDASQGKFCALYRRHALECLANPPKEFRGAIKLEAK